MFVVVVNVLVVVAAVIVIVGSGSRRDASYLAWVIMPDGD